MRAFDIHAPLPAAGVVLLVMNVVTIFPFWPGNVGVVQVAIASALVGYGVAYGRGVAYGFGLQAIEASVGIGVGLLFLAREGLSLAMLRVMPRADQAEMPSGSRRPRSRRAAAGARRCLRLSPLAPASLKGVLAARDAAAALAAGFAAAGVVCDECPVADGGEGTATRCRPRSAAPGGRRRCPIRSAVRLRRGGSSFRTALRSSRRRP